MGQSREVVKPFLISPKQDECKQQQIAALFLPKKEEFNMKAKEKKPAIAIIIGVEKPMKEMKKKKMMGGGAVTPMMLSKPKMAKGGMAKKKC